MKVVTELLGIDISGARNLSTLLEAWAPDATTVVDLVADAERLSDIPTATNLALDQIGSDGTMMATAVTSATDALEAFTINLDSPFTVAAALTSVQNFDGGDNDPELDRRLRVLRELVEAHTSSDTETAQVMSRLLALDQPADVRFRDVSAIDEARAELTRLSELEARNAISGNDPRLDQALAALRAAVAEHTTSDEETAALVRALIGEGGLATPTLVASVLTGHEVETVEVAHAYGLDYDVAHGLLVLTEVDELTATIEAAPSTSVVGSAITERYELLVELAGTDDSVVIAGLLRGLADGLPAADAFATIDQNIAANAHDDKVDAVAEAFGLNTAAAEARLAEMQASTVALAERGWPIEDAAFAAQVAAFSDFELSDIEALADADDSTLEDAFNKLAGATAAGMTPVEFDAYEGLVAHFEVFDNAKGGDTDEKVTLSDLEYVVNNPSEFDAEVVAAAAAVIAAPMLRHRIDTATENTDVVGGDSFGNTRADDNEFSLGDLEQFQYKQAVNFLLGDHADAIDVSQQGGDLGRVDGTHSKKDFQTFLDNNRANLDDNEIAALELVIEAEWYDKGWWDEHKGSIALAAAVVAGGAIFVATGGTGGGLSAVLISSAYAAGAGAVAGGATTLTINGFTDQEWDDDLLANTVQGGIGGLAGAGLAGAPSAFLGSGSLGLKTVVVLGGTSDLAGLTAAGLFDPALDPFLDDIDLSNLHDYAQTTSYVTGGAALTGGLTIGGRQLLSRLDVPTSSLAPGQPGQRAVNQVGGTQNCTSCVIAGDATLGGNPSSAVDLFPGIPIPNGNQLIADYAGSAWQTVAGRAEIDKLLLEAGEGARGVVYGARPDGTAHVFNAIVQNGRINYVDFQIAAGVGASFEGFSSFAFVSTNW